MFPFSGTLVDEREKDRPELVGEGEKDRNINR
jgi:hypothetical protein